MICISLASETSVGTKYVLGDFDQGKEADGEKGETQLENTAYNIEDITTQVEIAITCVRIHPPLSAGAGEDNLQPSGGGDASTQQSPNLAAHPLTKENKIHKHENARKGNTNSLGASGLHLWAFCQRPTALQARSKGARDQGPPRGGADWRYLQI